jgi:hypothetical protein
MFDCRSAPARGRRRTRKGPPEKFEPLGAEGASDGLGLVSSAPISGFRPRLQAVPLVWGMPESGPERCSVY